MQTRQRIALQKAWPAGRIRSEIDAREISAAEQPIGVERMRTNLLEVCRLKTRRHMVAHPTTEVALGFERIQKRFTAILGGRDLHQTDQRSRASVAPHAGRDFHAGEKLLHEDGTHVAVAQPAAALGCGRASSHNDSRRIPLLDPSSFGFTTTG